VSVSRGDITNVPQAGNHRGYMARVYTYGGFDA